jgi:hypothetical protein
MRPGGSEYDRARREEGRRRRRQAGHRRLAILVGFLALVILAIGLGVGLSGGGSETTSTTSPSASGGSTTTSVGGGSTESTSTTAGTGSTTETTSGSTTTEAQTFTAQLSGQQEVPPVSSSATGTLTMTVSADKSSVSYVLTVSKIANLTVARLHEGAEGKNGSTIATLYGGPTKSGSFTGTVAQGKLTKANLVGPLQGKTIEDLVALLEAGSVYLNVGTTKHTSGEIRGQLEPVTSTETISNP